MRLFSQLEAQAAPILTPREEHRIPTKWTSYFLSAALEPLTGLAAMAFGARPVPAAVVVPERLIAVVAVVEPSPQLWSAAGGDVRKRLLLRGHHPVAVLGDVLGTESADDVGQLDVGLGRVNAGINHGWASVPRRGRR